MPGTGSTGAGIAEFTGVLVRRHYRPGQKFVQLIFETAEGNRLSLSRNAQLVQSLVPGEIYRISGMEREMGGRRYVHEPTAVLVQPGDEPASSDKPFLRRHLRVIIGIVIAVALIAAAIAVTIAKHKTAPVSNVTSNTGNAQTSQPATDNSGQVQGVSTVNDQQTPSNTSVTSPATTSATTPKTITHPVSTATTQPVTTQTPTPAAPAAPTTSTTPPQDTTVQPDPAAPATTPPSSDTTTPPSDNTTTPPSDNTPSGTTTDPTVDNPKQ